MRAVTSSTDPTPSIRRRMPALLVVRKELGGHRVVRVEAFRHDVFAVVGPVLQVRPRGGGLYFKW
jgi:hypothetical protein